MRLCAMMRSPHSTADRAAARVIRLAALLALAFPALAKAQITDRTRLVAALDSAAQAHADHPMVAGFSIAVVRGTDTLLHRGYGFANLEWKVPTPADASASYEIGSVTKQFTAVAVLQLVEQGKLDLDEDFTKYLPDYDAKGHHVPLRRLLDHTSGIKGYTEMSVFGDIASKKLPRDTMVSLVESEPFEFEPGTAQIYNNSAFFMLGLIIEKVSGETYEDYIAKHVFEAAGMTDSYYCSESDVKDRKATGYDGSPNGLVVKRYLDHTWPYAAGSLCSTTLDLLRWNRSLHGGRILRPESYTAMTTPMPLVDGSELTYGMGIGVSRRGNERVISHGGGINGFVSDLVYYPEHDLSIAVLQNSTGPRGAGNLSSAVSQLIFGPVPPPAAAPYQGTLDALVGDYAGPTRGTHMHMKVTRDGDQLVIAANDQANGARPIHTNDGTWVVGGTAFRFVMADGRALELRMKQGSGYYVLRRVR